MPSENGYGLARAVLCTLIVCACLYSLVQYEIGPRWDAMAKETSCENMADVARQAARVAVGIGADAARKGRR